jgi:RNA polymerase sigma-70 factor, ECF subfamily
MQVMRERPPEALAEDEAASLPGAGEGVAPSTPASAHLPEDFVTFYRREYPRVVALGYALTGRRSTAEDLAQDAFFAAHQRWSKVGYYDHPEAFVRRAVANAAISVGRRLASEARAVRRLALRSRTGVEDLEPPDAQFWSAVRRLPPRQAQVTALYYLEDRSAEEIAAILGCSAATVPVHLHRARQALQTMLSQEGGRHGDGT